MLNLVKPANFFAHLAFLSTVSLSASAGMLCENVLKATTQEVYQKVLGERLKAGLVYPKGFEGKDGKHFQYGFESEYVPTPESLSSLLKVYAPRAEFRISHEEWNAKSDTEKIAWIKATRADRPESGKDTGLEFISQDPSLQFMPKELILDETGNLEIVLSPVDSHVELIKQIDLVNAKFGLGSMQAMISTPKDAFFKNEDAVQEKLGYYTFTADRDALQKLSQGAARYKKDATKETARSFLHPFLGPMSAKKQEVLKDYLVRGKEGSLTKEDLKFVAASDESFKYVGSTAHRPDIGGSKRVSDEVRDAHVAVDHLKERVQRVLIFSGNGTEAFAKFGKLKSIDTQEDFARLPREIQDFLKQIFPAKIPGDMEFTKDEILSRETYRNFSYPLRDWSAYLKVMGKDRVIPMVEKQSQKYVEKLEQIRIDLAEGQIDVAAAKVQVQGQLALWGSDSHLAEVFEAFENQMAANTVQ